VEKEGAGKVAAARRFDAATAYDDRDEMSAPREHPAGTEFGLG
jgi:hypothetical protein